ncbi:MAG: OPT/YSL family transporter, partial [Bacteroidetes bacterium]|nr:OPT/YSL family transporter [Bacteroidota bacterium]
MDEHQVTKSGLPENAYRELKEGEEYLPVMDPRSTPPEVTPWSVIWGLLMAVVFSAAAAYSGLKIGQVFEAAIPIAILAVGLSAVFRIKNALGQNVIIQSIGANSSHVVAGAVFTIPALYMLAAEAGSGVAEPTVLQVIIVSFLGGCLGILFLIPLRYHFMVELHGKL